MFRIAPQTFKGGWMFRPKEDWSFSEPSFADELAAASFSQGGAVPEALALLQGFSSGPLTLG